MAPLLDDLAVNELGDLGGGVILRSVKLIGLGGSAVVLKHDFQSRADVDSLQIGLDNILANAKRW